MTSLLFCLSTELAGILDSFNRVDSTMCKGHMGRERIFVKESDFSLGITHHQHLHSSGSSKLQRDGRVQGTQHLLICEGRRRRPSQLASFKIS